MQKKFSFIYALALSLMLFAGSPAEVQAQQGKDVKDVKDKDKQEQGLQSPADRDARRTELLKEEVRHQLVMLPYYNVFDWLEASLSPDGTVTLSGQVTRPTTKSDAEARIRNLEGATSVVNKIEVLPVSTSDERLRLAAYRAIFAYSSPLFRYAMQSVPPIHIIVNNGRLVLKGIVGSSMDSQLAYTAARQVPGIFDVQNQLKVEGETKESTKR